MAVNELNMISWNYIRTRNLSGALQLTLPLPQTSYSNVPCLFVFVYESVMKCVQICPEHIMPRTRLVDLISAIIFSLIYADPRLANISLELVDCNLIFSRYGSWQI